MNARLFPPLFFLSFSSQSAYCNRIRAEKQEAAYGSPAGTGHAGSRKRKILRGFRAGVVGSGVLGAPQRKVTVFAAAFLLFDRVLRDCHVALLLAMTHQVGAAAHQCPSAVELPCTRRSLSAAAFFSRTADLYGSPQPTENIQNLAIRARTVHFYATRICDSSQLVKHYFFEKGIDLFLICVMLFL